MYQWPEEEVNGEEGREGIKQGKETDNGVAWIEIRI